MYKIKTGWSYCVVICFVPFAVSIGISVLSKANQHTFSCVSLHFLAFLDLTLMSMKSFNWKRNGTKREAIRSTDPFNFVSSVIQFYIRLGCSDFSPYSDTEAVYVQYSTDAGITWRTLRQLDFRSNYGVTQYVTLDVPDDARTNASRVRWRQVSMDGAYLEDWALEQVWSKNNWTLSLLYSRRVYNILPRFGGDPFDVCRKILNCTQLLKNYIEKAM